MRSSTVDCGFSCDCVRVYVQSVHEEDGGKEAQNVLLSFEAMPMCELNFASFFSRFHIIESLSFKEYLLGLQKYCYLYNIQFSTVQLLSCVRLCDPIDCSTPGLRVHHQLPEFTQNSCPLSRSCHPTISSSVVPFFSRLQSFPAPGSFPMSQFLTSGGHRSYILSLKPPKQQIYNERDLWGEEAKALRT